MTKKLHSFTPAQSLFPKHHTGFIDISGHLLWSLAGSCADGTGSSQETAAAKANLNISVSVAQAKGRSEINRTVQPPVACNKYSKSKSSHRWAMLLSACVFLGSAFQLQRDRDVQCACAEAFCSPELSVSAGKLLMSFSNCWAGTGAEHTWLFSL